MVYPAKERGRSGGGEGRERERERKVPAQSRSRLCHKLVVVEEEEEEEEKEQGLTRANAMKEVELDVEKMTKVVNEAATDDWKILQHRKVLIGGQIGEEEEVVKDRKAWIWCQVGVEIGMEG